MIQSIHVVYKHPFVDNEDISEKVMDKLYVSPIHVSLLLRRVKKSMSVYKSLEYYRKMTNCELEAIVIAKLDDGIATLENDDTFSIIPNPSPAELIIDIPSS